MKRIDKLIVLEMTGPWVFGVAIFTVLIMAGTYLYKITDFIVAGVPLALILKFTLYLLPGIMVKTFSMAVLLSTLLAFGRLSGDSEIVAMKAAGASVPRMMIPVAAFSLIVALLAFGTNELIVSRASYAGETLKLQLEKSTQRQPIFYQIFNADKLQAMIMARNFNLATKQLEDATVKVYDNDQKPVFILEVPSMTYNPTTKEWRLGAGTRELSLDGQTFAYIGPTYPKDLPKPPSDQDLLAAQVKDLDVLSMAQMKLVIASKSADPGFPKDQLANLQYGYYNKIALPLATLIFGLLGAPLGIRSHRTGTATGFWLSVIIIFAYMMLANLMNIINTSGQIPPYVASFTPLGVGLVLAIVLIWRKNL